jgi:hypothetical protein
MAGVGDDRGQIRTERGKTVQQLFAGPLRQHAGPVDCVPVSEWKLVGQIFDSRSASLLPGQHQDDMSALPLVPFSDRLPAGIELLLPLPAAEELGLAWSAPQYRRHSITVRRPSCGIPRLVASIGYAANS